MSVLDCVLLALSLLGCFSAAMVAFNPNILYAAIYLILALLSTSGIYAVLGADFLAGVQLIIYVGGVIIVILFAIMMSENIYKKRFLDGAGKFLFPGVIATTFLVLFLQLIKKTTFNVIEEPIREVTTTRIGQALIGDYALVFQYVAIVLLMGLIGAVIVARPHYKKEDR